jgi:hypothetical protein
MGTRSLTFVYSDDSIVLNMYRQFDGYPTGHGLELADFLNSFEAITNGYSFNETRRIANGMPCLAGQLVANFKVGHGGFYLYPADSTDCGQEYEYHVYEDKIVVKECYDNTVIFSGSWSEFAEFCKAPVTEE